MVSTRWQSTASLDVLRARAALLQSVRKFFAQLNVLEVETPLLSHAIGSDPLLHPVIAQMPVQSECPLFLQTSPEFAMKRLLAQGSGPIFQIARAFRSGDQGSKHNPEFTLLEWYQPNYSLEELITEVLSLVSQFIALVDVVRLTYREAFLNALRIDPFQSSLKDLIALGRAKVSIESESEDRDFWLDLLFSHEVEPHLPKVCVLFDFPASQAALAKIAEDEHGNKVAKRFELIVNSIELANGYDELQDVDEQRARFESDRKKREQLGLPVYPEDNNYLQALESGLPTCCGVALGLDRLLMLSEGLDSISEVLSFDFNRA